MDTKIPKRSPALFGGGTIFSSCRQGCTTWCCGSSQAFNPFSEQWLGVPGNEQATRCPDVKMIVDSSGKNDEGWWTKTSPAIFVVATIVHERKPDELVIECDWSIVWYLRFLRINLELDVSIIYIYIWNYFPSLKTRDDLIGPSTCHGKNLRSNIAGCYHLNKKLWDFFHKNGPIIKTS